MNLLKVSWSNLKGKPLSTILSLLLLTLGVGIISLLLLLNHQLQEKFTKNLEGIDMVVGAKGSPLQLILSSVYHVDYPTGNISLAEANKLLRHPLVKQGIPLAYGDSYNGYRIVGTKSAYVDHYGASVANGQLWKNTFEVVLGANVAQQSGLQIGSTFFSSHGLVAEGAEEHNHQAFTVVGVLAPNNSVVDQLILTGVESVWAIHDHEGHDHEHDDAPHHDHAQQKTTDTSNTPIAENQQKTAQPAQFHTDDNHEGHHHDHEGHDHDHEGHNHDHEGHDHDHEGHDEGHDHDHEGHDHEGHDHDHEGHDHEGHDHDHEGHDHDHKAVIDESEQEITALLVKFRNPMGLMQLPRLVNGQTNMQAALPAVEVNRLMNLLGVGMDTLRAIALAIMLVAGISVFISLYNSLKDRHYEMALMRSLGASRGQLFSLIMQESILLTVTGFFAGMLFSRIGISLLAQFMRDSSHYSLTAWQILPQEAFLFIAALGIGFIAALLPAIQASNTNISKTLAGA